MTRFFGLRGNSLNVVTILGVLMPGILSVGYNAASLGGVLSLESFEKQFHEIDITDASDRTHASAIQGTVVAVYTVGGFIGTFVCIWLGDMLGRRRVIMAGAIVQVIGAILNASAYSLAQLIASRLVIGIGTGAFLATIPLWLSEISPASKRGAHVATKGVFSGFGCALALFLDFGLSFRGGSMAWRLPAAFPLILSVAVFGFIVFLPESPRWLIRQGRISEAQETLAALEDTTIDDGKIETRIEEMQASLVLAGDQKSLAQLFHMGPQRTSHRAFLAIAAMTFLQLTGATVTTFYTTAIFENNLQLGESTSRLLAAVYQLVGPIGGVVCVLTIEGLGRRKLLMGSAAGNAICLALIASLGSQTGNLVAAHGAVFFIFLFHFSYIIGFGGIPYLYASEISPMHLRSTITSISISISWAISILVANITPIAFNAMGQRYFLIFAGFNAAMIPAIFYFFPETSGRSLEEIDEIFALSNSLLDAVPTAKKLPPRQPHNLPEAEKVLVKSLESPV
ncbi:uncharacterized protein N7482_002574 [Penicillium canariense]|uniref:Major facilitator superfamily (MFS) profile domain-containing protein n=1 Tax=Penicillium canariense TaxID=189055 RepID=A0A9W9IHY3_9EURO|nr:uncharacterized protein N7482_002574 [Penicillium canariense]KAJ5176697.1 hypothetical protein N7482_002574 [Penicillium canariense]